ncbi:acylphosphatase [Phaeobacter marinintestinus]|uniref:acylphosphatase n=1 Tax=Falsiphaeobacter marinintestinus TaxID=1492905 RepID=UPI0011B68897|nr:acylphosphatase [Phaeobacter marinintestinus]
MARIRAVQARVMGQVQGVAYRAWTRGTAETLGLRGWVRNEPNGSVSALLIGPQDKIDDMIARMWDGPGAASVRDVERHPETVVDGFEPFEIHR